jgi:hypothetical protein
MQAAVQLSEEIRTLKVLVYANFAGDSANLVQGKINRFIYGSVIQSSKKSSRNIVCLFFLAQ